MPELISLSIHLCLFGAMGLIVPAMLIRILQEYTGRNVPFDSIDKLLLKIVMPAFGLLAWRYIPVLLRPRIDGKPH